MSPDEIAKHAARAIEACRALSASESNAFVMRLLLTPEVIAAAVTAYLADPQSDDEYYAAHDCAKCDPTDHCVHLHKRVPDA